MSGTAPGKEFMGRGWAWPFRLDPVTGRVATAADEEDIQQALLIILGTTKGERVMRPEFGCGIHDLVYAAIDTATVAQIQRDVKEAVCRFEARIDLLEVRIETSNLIDGRLDVELHYRVRSTNQRGNWVYPFYFREGR